MYHTTLRVTQQMHRRATGHVEVCITEYGKGFSMPSSASFGKSQVWSERPLPSPIRIADAYLSMPSPLEALLLAFALAGLDAGYQLVTDCGAATRAPRRPTFGGEARAAGAPSLRHAAKGGSAFGSFEEDGGGERATRVAAKEDGEMRRPAVQHLGRSQFLAPVLRSSPTCQHSKARHGCNRDWAWPKCEDCGAVEQIPKLTPDKLTEWNSVLVYQAPNYQTPAAAKEAKEAKKAAKATTTSTNSTAPASTAQRRTSPTTASTARPTSSTMPAASARPTSSTVTAAMARAWAASEIRPPSRSQGPMAPDEGEIPRHPPRPRRDGPMEVDEFSIGTPDSAAFPPPTSAGDWEGERDMAQATLDVMMPGSALTRSCTQCPGELTLNWHEEKGGYLWMCARGDPNCQFTWSGSLDLNKLMTAFEIRLCLNCQQEALKPHELRDRMAWRCPRCRDQILASEWDEVMATFLRAGGYNPDRTHQWMENGRP